MLFTVGESSEITLRPLQHVGRFRRRSLGVSAATNHFVWASAGAWMTVADIDDAFSYIPLAPWLWAFMLFRWFLVSGDDSDDDASSSDLHCYVNLFADFGTSSSELASLPAAGAAGAAGGAALVLVPPRDAPVRGARLGCWRI